MKRDITLKRLLGVITLDQTYIEFALPILTLVFFDPASRLFPADTSLATRSMWYGTCLSIPSLINLFFAPLLSTLSDEFGRRKFLLFEISSAFLYMTLAGLGVLLGHLWLLIAGFIVRGAFSRTNTTALAIVGDSTSGSAKLKWMSRLQIAISIGACIGPIISGFFANRYFFDTLNFSLPFFIAAVLAFLNAALTYFLMNETLQQKSSHAFRDMAASRLRANLLAIKFVMTHPDILKTALILLLAQIGWSTYYQFMPPLLKTVYHFNAHTLGIFIGMIAFWLIFGAWPVFNWIHKHFNPHEVMNISIIMELIGFAFTLATYFHLLPQYTLWAAVMPVAIGDMLSYISLTTIFSNIVPDHMQGKVMGINFLIVGLIWGGTSLIGGILIGFNPILPMLFAPLGTIGAFMVMNMASGKRLIHSYSH
jgi:DHA1 family tetracycline resistance protein-like MFS transporter